MMRNFGTALVGLLLAGMLSACEPEVGSQEWCKMIEDKGVANVTANEAADYARECVL
ncbi:MAG: DUF3012 domain-containing protein [Alphaproteobacteria bacterium]